MKRPAGRGQSFPQSNSALDPSGEPVYEPATHSEVQIKLDLARQFIDMGDPEGARHMLNEVIEEGDSAQQREAQRLLELLP
jgi:pilus assembly protein FimV